MGSLLLFLLVAFISYGVKGGENEKRLLEFLLATQRYNSLERPVAIEKETLSVSFGLTLMQIIDVNEKDQILTTNIWLNLEWNDYNLHWNDSDYGGLNNIRISPNKLWRPDILMYNSADEGFDGAFPTNIVVRNNGSCLYVPPGIFKSTCKIDITWFPFDDQMCSMKFGSWTYDGNQVDLTMKDDAGGDLTSFISNGEWELLGMPGLREVKYYTCCPEPYVSITYTIQIRRRTLYYFFNLIVPCVLISSMALLGFTLPPDSGEKLTLGTYFNCIMFMVASSVVLTVVVLNYHHRTANMHAMPPWVKTLFLQWLPWILQMSRPGKKITRETIKMDHKMKSLKDIKERSSKSLLANVLDMDDDIRTSTSYLRMDSATEMTSSCALAQKDLQGILRELRFITGRMKKAEEDAEIVGDWKFAAMVVDRICLIVFTSFTIIATVCVLLSAPHIIVQ